MLALTFATVVMTIWLYGVVPKGFLVEQDTGLLSGTTIAAPVGLLRRDVAAAAERVADIILKDPCGGRGQFECRRGLRIRFRQSRPDIGDAQAAQPARRQGASEIIARLRPKLNAVPGLRTVLFAAQDIRGGGRSGGAQYQFLVLDSNLAGVERVDHQDRERAAPRTGFRRCDLRPGYRRAGGQARISIVVRRRAFRSRSRRSTTRWPTRFRSARFRPSTNSATSTRSCWKQCAVAAAGPALSRSCLCRGRYRDRRCRSAVVVAMSYSTAPLTVRHEGELPTSSISFNLDPSLSLGSAMPRAQAIAAGLHPPSSLHTDFAGNAKWASDSLASEPALAAGRVAVDLHRARRALRKPAAPADDPVDTSIGRRRRACSPCWSPAAISAS